MDRNNYPTAPKEISVKPWCPLQRSKINFHMPHRSAPHLRENCPAPSRVKFQGRPVLHTAKPINIMCVIFNLMECTMTDRPISDDLSKCWQAKLFGWIQKINVPAISVDSSQHVGCSICQLIQNHSSHQQIFTRKQGFGKRNLKGLLAFGNHS